MRKTFAVLALAGLMLGRPSVGRADSPGREAGLALGAAVSNLLYVPVKILFATGGLIVGSWAGLLTGGDVRAAYAVWVPTASGTYFLRPAHLEGTEPLEFVGTDYADRPSTAIGGAGLYEVEYSR